MPHESIEVVLVHPDLLGLYGDRGNALALQHVAAQHGIDVRVVEAPAGGPVPRSADLYLVGGGEDGSMLLSYRLLLEDGGLGTALEHGAPCLAVCAGFQILAERFVGPDGVSRAGLGVLDVDCPRLPGNRAVGDVVARGTGPVADPILGFENHQGGAVLGPAARPLGRVEVGVGNGFSQHEGAVQGAVVATYLHGPVLAFNPQLSNHLLKLVLGRPLPPSDEPSVTRLRRERLRAAGPLGAMGHPWRHRRRTGARPVAQHGD
ncbi:MAG: type 1 glutamine amidotransferase [Marmoricola sp.]